ncbi:hypothetical protein FCM35_KLT08446 [Carex littledalei]|uniref:Uncharacterized protein n=1 Tax=Carex littledalei TaxID=544730 RepID=A0A833V6Q5_9POAL|nr:hypothetical protein FCM35_KLT08446 [Carex littledalei]
MLTSSLLLYSKSRRIQSKTLSSLFYFSTQTLSHLFPPRQSNGATSGKQERNHMPVNSTCAPIGRTRYDSKSVGKKTNDAIFPREMSPEMASFLRRLKEEGCLKDGDFNYEKPLLCNSYSLNLLKSATEQFGLKHQPIAKWLSGGELKQVALFGCPSVERRTVMAAKCLRSFFRIEENTVCESCKVKTSCRFANQRVERQEKVILTYVMRLLVLYALNAIPQELSISENLKLSINKLLNEVINLST